MMMTGSGRAFVAMSSWAVHPVMTKHATVAKRMSTIDLTGVLPVL
jgi:hypothetical protein